MLKPVSILGYLVMVGGLIGLIATRNLFSLDPVVITLQSSALLLLLWARVTFGRRSFHLAANPTKGGLVTTGPYRYIRHPIYAAVCLFTFTGVLTHWSLRSVAFGALILAGTLFRIYAEESLVTAQYPEYRDYAARTWRLVPFLF